MPGADRSSRKSPSADGRARRFALTLLCGVLCSLGGLHCSRNDAGGVLVLVREGDPASEAIARAYLSRLSQAPGAESEINEIAVLSMPDEIGWAIELEDYQQWIAGPLEERLAEIDPKRRITTLITTRGIPLRVGTCQPEPAAQPRNAPGSGSTVCAAASVDALLAGLGRLAPSELRASDRAGIGQTPNPYFGESRSFVEFRRAHPEAPLRFLVGRLSGPSRVEDDSDEIPASVRALLAEPEPAPPRDPFRWSILAGSPAEQRTAATTALLAPVSTRLAGIPNHSVCDDCPERHDRQSVSGIILSRNRRPQVALDQAGLRLGVPGLAIDLIGARPSWTRMYSDPPENPLDRSLASWIDAGAHFVSTHLADPSLAGVARPDLLVEGLAQGRTIGEAHFRSLPHLGWLNVLVGDPLARLPLPEAPGENDLAEAEAADAADTPDTRQGERFDPAVWLEDRDRDGVVDAEDNCLLESNPKQRDTDADGYGNRCDPDVNNDGRILTSWGRIYPRSDRGDLEEIALTVRSGPHDPNHDLDGDGSVDERDLALAQLWLFRGPGPSGRVP